MQVLRITDAEELAGLAARWNGLAAGIPFRAWDWLEAWWRHYGGSQSPESGDTELCVLTVENSREIGGIVPWYTQSSPWSGRTLRFLGAGEVCSDYLGLLARPGAGGEVAGAVADWLTGEAADLWDLIELTEVEAGDPVVRDFADKMIARDNSIDQRPGPNCWRLELPPTWDEYVGELSKSHRKQVRRMERRLFDSGRAKLNTVRNEADIARIFGVLVELHQRRQMRLNRPGCFASPQFLAFHLDVVRRLFESDRLRLHWLELDGRPVAAEYHIAGDGGVFAYQGGIDPAALDEWPGQLITLATLKLAIEQRFRYFDFLRGDEPYKAHWRAQPRPTVKLRVIPNRLAARLRHGVWAAARRIKEQMVGSATASNGVS